MNNVEEQILSYPRLSTEEKREVDAYVEDHPEWAALLRDVRSLESLTPAGDDAIDGPASPLLTAYVAAEHFQVEDVSPKLDEVFTELEKRLQKDSDLRERVDAIRQRLEEAEEALDPVHHFEEVTGYTLPSSGTGESHVAEPTSPRTSVASDRERTPPVGTLVDQLLGLSRPVRWAGAALVLLLGTYIGLFAASEASESTLDRLAAVEVSDQVVENYSTTRTRSVTPAPDTTTVDDVYLEALSTLRTARSSTLGLFPSYDTTALERAERQLTEVLDRTNEESFLALEARFYLGKVYLAQGRVDAAYDCFKTVIEQEGRKVEEARTVLRTLDAEYPEVGTNREE